MKQAKDPTRIHAILLKAIEASSKYNDRAELGRLRCHVTPRNRIRRDLGAEAVANHDQERHDAFLTKFCLRLFDATQDIEGHVERLDEIFAELFTLEVCLQPTHTNLAISEAASGTIRRLPEHTLGLPGLSRLPNDYFDDNEEPVSEDQERQFDYLTRRTLIWPCLKVTSWFSTNVLRVILFREIYCHGGSDGVEEKQLVDLTAELLEHCCKLEVNSNNSKNDLDRWLIVRCFLWASWQRGQMLYFYRLLYYRLHCGPGTDLGSLTMLRSYLVAPNLTIQQFSDKVANEGKAPYMCSWAFNLLRTDGIAVGSDFRLFHMRYNQLLGHNNARCNRKSEEACDGSQMGNCQRFKIHAKDQSMHDRACSGNCKQLIWDEESYRSIKGGRAVDVHNTDFESLRLRYRAASDKTLAITHAWAHGQGGRPSKGLNLCLHIRYIQIAQAKGCDSYFLDTACIPEERQLRKEAIQNINQTFQQSKMTLIVDKDLLTIEYRDDEIQLKECLLTSILVSDWNTRAWTLLESLKGRRNIHMLCHGAQTVSYRELVQAVASKGRIDIAIFALVAPHLLPYKIGGENDTEGIASEEPSLEVAGSLLSYRPTSRSDDELTIWALMINHINVLANDAEEFWSNLRGKRVATGFLVSSAERIGKKGLTWAPVGPYAASKEDYMPSESSDSKSPKHFFRAFTGEESEYAEIDERGIFAHWWAYEFDCRLLKTGIPALVHQAKKHANLKDENSTTTQDELDRMRVRYLMRYKFGALLLPKALGEHGGWSMHRHIARYSGGVSGELVVVLGSNRSQSTSFQQRGHHQLDSWEWLAVHEWPSGVDLPPCEEKMMWIA